MNFEKIDEIADDQIEKLQNSIEEIQNSILQSNNDKSYFEYSLKLKLKRFCESINPKKRKFSTSSDENDEEAKRKKSINKLEHTNVENGKMCIKLDPD